MVLAYTNFLQCKLWITDVFRFLNQHTIEDYIGTLVYVMSFLF